MDLLALDEPCIGVALDTVAQGSGRLPYVALPYLVLMKLAAGRVQDIADVTRMLDGADERSLAAVREAVRKHRPQDADETESMIRRRADPGVTSDRRPGVPRRDRRAEMLYASNHTERTCA